MLLQGTRALFGEALMVASFAVEVFGSLELIADTAFLLFASQPMLMMSTRVIASGGVVAMVAAIFVLAKRLLVAPEHALPKLASLLLGLRGIASGLLARGLLVLYMFTLLRAFAFQRLDTSGLLHLTLAVFNLSWALLLLAFATLLR